METHRVLGISLGTRKMGLAVLDRYSIFDCCVKSFPGRWSTGKKRAILKLLSEYLEIYHVTQVIVRVPTLSVEAPAVIELLDEIERLAATRKINFYKCTLAELKARFELDIRANKKEIMRVVLKKYGELQQEYERTMKSRVKHFEKVFEAVGIAAVAK
jgi:hypothetical protein